MENQLAELAARVDTRARQLLARHEQLRQELGLARQELRRREDDMEALRRENEELREKYSCLKAARCVDMADDDVKDLRGRIRKMVRDIDKCVAMLKVESHE